LLPVNHNQGVDLALGDQPGSNGCFSESSRSAEDAFIEGRNLGDGFLLGRPKLALKLGFDRHAQEPFVPNLWPNLVRFEKSQSLRETTPRDRDVLNKFLAARDYARLVVCREPHSLGFVEFRVLKSCQPQYAIQHGGREIFTFHVDEVARTI
jgi:hypothetical protein